MKIMDNERPLSYWAGIAKQNGISRRTFNLRRKAGYSKQEAATRPLMNSGCRNAKPNSHRQISLRAGLGETAVSSYYLRNPTTTLTPEQIVKKLKDAKKAFSIDQMAKMAGLATPVVSSRLRNGWTLEKALCTPPMSASESARNAGRQKGKRQRQQRAARQQRDAQTTQALNNALTQ